MAGWYDDGSEEQNQLERKWLQDSMVPECCGYDSRKAHTTIGKGKDGYFHRKGCPNGPHIKGCQCVNCKVASGTKYEA